MNNNQQALYTVEDRWVQRLEWAREQQTFTYDTLGGTWDLPVEKWFTNLEQCTNYVKRVVDTDGIRQMPPEHPEVPEVVESKYNNKASYNKGKISIPDSIAWRRELTLLHELGHHYGGGGHGKRFLDSYFRLIEVMMSPELSYLIRIELLQEMEDLDVKS